MDMTDMTKRLKEAFPEISTALQRNRDGKAYFSFGFRSGSDFATCSAIGMWLRDNVDRGAYMTSGGGIGATFRLPKFTVVKEPPKVETIEVVQDRYGKSIQVGSRVAFNHCGCDVAIGFVEKITLNPMSCWARRNYKNREKWAERTNRSLTFHVLHVNPDLDGYTISKVINKGSIVVI
jgi:hypothetical protein